MSSQDDRLQILFLGADASLEDEATGLERLLAALGDALRARNFLGNRQSVLDHSLTQFFRVAARS